ncbi:hypothetical protein ASE14_15195 [Agromyces sp. Root81]|nr:hypothetical protein ASE14_15195 [Agromyces sp. Root81]
MKDTVHGLGRFTGIKDAEKMESSIGGQLNRGKKDQVTIPRVGLGMEPLYHDPKRLDRRVTVVISDHDSINAGAHVCEDPVFE